MTNRSSTMKSPSNRRIRRRTSRRPTQTTKAAALFLSSLFLCSASTAEALRILLTNDDGLEKPGLQVLRSALIEDGHEVHVYAPATDRTGLGASVTLTVPLIDLGTDPPQTIVQGPPASCVVAGLSVLQHNLLTTETGEETVVGLPDLVVVGISDGFATGAQTMHSSSVGAALTALNRGIPALTVAGLPPARGQNQYYAQVADFTVRFIQEWVDTVPLNDMPKGFGMKIAYPAAGAAPLGVQLADNGRQAPISLGYVPSLDNPNVYQVAPVLPLEDAPPMDQDSESAIVDSDKISVLPISDRLYVLERDFNVRYILTLRRMIRDIEP